MDILDTCIWYTHHRKLTEKVYKKNASPFTSLADPGCLSRIPDHEFHPTRIPDPKRAIKKV